VAGSSRVTAHQIGRLMLSSEEAIGVMRGREHSPYMIGANGSVRGKKEFEPSSLAAESEPLLGPHLEDY
jgi:hypothetical protein